VTRALRGRKPGIGIDLEVARVLVRGLRKAARQLGLDDELKAGQLAGLPGVVLAERLPEDAVQMWSVVKRALSAALGELLEMRCREGAALEKDLRRRFKTLERVAGMIKRRAPVVTRRYRKLLRERLLAAGAEIDTSDPLLVKEVALFAERCDISEELVRLASHFDQASALMRGSQKSGRALDFLCQEMLREINTIGSKGNDAQISRRVIAFKAELGSVREQVQNVE